MQSYPINLWRLSLLAPSLWLAACQGGDSESSPGAPLGVTVSGKSDLDGDSYDSSVDCDDNDASVNPGASESDNLIDDDCDGWVDEDFVAAGDLVITEINRQSRFGTAQIVRDGSWVEVYNVSDRTIDLSNWVVARGTTSTSNQITVDPATAPVVAPGEYVVFCDTDNYVASVGAAYPLACDYVWGDETQAATYVGTYHDNTFFLGRDNDAFALYIGGSRTTGQLIDEVHWTYDATNGYWPREARFSTSLDPAYYDADFNDDLRAWCSTTATSAGVVSNSVTYRWYNTSGTINDEHGTPGAQNYDCQTTYDLDGDGYTTDDCDDTDANANPGAAEVCDGVDNDCDGSIDNGETATTYYQDADGDGYGNPSVTTLSCTAPSGYVADATDCNDANAGINPGEAEVCDDVDQDCDGSIDEDATGADRTFYADVDADGYGDSTNTTTGCSSPDGYTSDNTDCDDLDPDIYPDATELENGLDDDCDGAVDENFVDSGSIVITEFNRQSRFGGTTTINNGSWVEVYNASSQVVDMAGWMIARGTVSSGNQVVLDPATAPVLSPGDYAVFCDSNDYESSATAAYPLVCDYIWGDESQPASYVGTYHDNTFYLRRDDDTFSIYAGGDRTTAPLIDSVHWTYNSADGYWPRIARFTTTLDPDYLDATQNDLQTRWCSTTADSTGATANNTSYSWFDVTTSSNDEHGTPGAANYNCALDVDGDGYTTDDCNDADPAVNPGATEVCDGVDNDCDGIVDEGGTSGSGFFYEDADGDGYGNPDVWASDCTAPAGYVTDDEDCNDGNASINPGVEEVCDGTDNNCDGNVDEGGDPITWYYDADGDGFGADDTTTTSCSQPSGYVMDGGDCNDASVNISPGEEEVCNDGIDNDCDAATTCFWGSQQLVKEKYSFRCYGDVANYAVGSSIANNGDWNGDGYDDVVVGQSYWDVSPYTDEGRVLVFYGPVNESQLIADADFTIEGTTTRGGDQFGSASTFVGDWNGDSKDDLLVSAARANTADQGAAYLLLGGSGVTNVSAATATFTTTLGNAYLGSAVSAGDIDDDGTPDIALAAYNRGAGVGSIGVWNGTGVSGAEDLTTTSSFYVAATTASANFGYAIDMSSDLDGDGAADLIVGAPGASTGFAYLFYGVDTLSGALSPTAADATISGAASGDRFGLALAALGDTDGDGTNDFVVTADKNDGAGTDAGAAYVFYAAPSGSVGAASVADTIFRGEAAGDYFGRSTSIMGDVDNDGYNDLVVGATAWDLGTIANAGGEFVWYGPFASGTVSASTHDALFTGANDYDAIGFASAGGGDVNADGYADFMLSATSWDSFGLLNAGAAWLYYGGTD